MWTLTIEDEDGSMRELALEQASYTIGRSVACDVTLEDRNISRRHARLELDDERRWWLHDLDTRYGCFVNGQRIRGRVWVSQNDVLQIGGYCLGLKSAVSERDDVLVRPTAPMAAAPWGGRDAPDRLLVLDGPNEGREVRLDRGPITIGVGAECTIKLPESLADEGVHFVVRPLARGRFEIVQRSETLRMTIRQREVERMLLENEDLVRIRVSEEGGDIGLRFARPSGCERGCMENHPSTARRRCPR